jgi:hypothetical protein
MFALLSRSTLLAGVLIAGLSAPAWSADTEAVRPTPPPATADPGTADDRPATSASAQTTAEVVVSQPTRAHSALTSGKRHTGSRARVGYNRPVHRYSLMLGIGY